MFASGLGVSIAGYGSRHVFFTEAIHRRRIRTKNKIAGHMDQASAPLSAPLGHFPGQVHIHAFRKLGLLFAIAHTGQSRQQQHAFGLEFFQEHTGRALWLEIPNQELDPIPWIAKARHSAHIPAHSPDRRSQRPCKGRIAPGMRQTVRSHMGPQETCTPKDQCAVHGADLRV